MDAELMERARAGLQAWQDGDLSALQELLDPDVELFWWEPRMPASSWNFDGDLRVDGQTVTSSATS